MQPSISSTILHVRYSEHANSKSVQTHLTVSTILPVPSQISKFMTILVTQRMVIIGSDIV